MANDMKTKRLESGEIIPAGWFGDFWDDVRSKTLYGDMKTCRVNRTPEGTTITVLRQPQSVGGSAAGYSGYFKVIDASTKEGETTTLKIKIVDGGDPDSETCGHATFNSTHFEISAPGEMTITASGFLFLKSTMGVDDPPLPLAPEFEYLTAWPDAEDGVGRRLIATATVDGSKMTITQQQHGEVQAFIWGACE